MTYECSNGKIKRDPRVRIVLFRENKNLFRSYSFINNEKQFDVCLFFFFFSWQIFCKHGCYSFFPPPRVQCPLQRILYVIPNTVSLCVRILYWLRAQSVTALSYTLSAVTARRCRGHRNLMSIKTTHSFTAVFYIGDLWLIKLCRYNYTRSPRKKS